MQTNVEISAPKLGPALERRRRWEHAYYRRLALGDAAVLLCSLTIGVAALSLGPAAAARRDPLVLGLPVLALGVTWMVLLSGMRSRRNDVIGSGIAEYRRVAHASGLALGLFAAFGILLEWEGMRLTLFVVGPAAILGLLVSRFLWRRWLHRQRLCGRNACRTLVVGFEDDVRYVIGSLQTGGENGFHVIGAALIGADRPEWIEIGERRIPIHGTIENVAAMTARIEADRIIVASTPPDRPDFIRQLSWELEGMAAELVLSHRVTDIVGPRISFTPVDGLPLLQITIPTYEGGKHMFKRALDLCVSVLALIPIAVIAPFIVAAIKLDSPGPVFYRQERLGRDGRRFQMLKFRTMRVGADAELEQLRALNEGSGPLFKIRSDPRVTRVGRILRRLSVDELPQFWNVLVGDMSVVGPRPPLPAEAQTYDGAETRRLYIKPGITGLWQVSGRSDLSWEESVRLDLRYVENWSLMQDLQIMWRTARVMFRPTGAY